MGQHQQPVKVAVLGLPQVKPAGHMPPQDTSAGDDWVVGWDR